MNRTIGALCAAALSACAWTAEAAVQVLDFDDLAKAGTGRDYIAGPSFEYGGFTFSSAYSESPHFLIWQQDAVENADRDGGTFAHRWDSFPMTISRADGGLFDLISFDFADIFNSGARATNQLAFTYGDGRTEYLSATSDGLVGLETLNLNRSGLKSVSLAANSREWWQIDNFTVGSAAAVPEPVTWAMMIMGFGGIGATLRRRRTMALA
ncbi:PEPxxWA-CTERM sorting domain-containing protein [Phenylobacterium sp. CCH12-B4]|uniref:PEPxxWA-CTERM sorting domain-containing protein n=1 Tax=Phenylobacterium sp. CCH12-B4 TaxID=1768784 RepID=UPI000839E403|nr:PEPxxWA-CTERM sorting domain-containing protein [Phenylobacterium sp. CCH12-B4]